MQLPGACPHNVTAECFFRLRLNAHFFRFLFSSDPFNCGGLHSSCFRLYPRARVNDGLPV